MDYNIKYLIKNEDERGVLVEVLRTDQIGEFNQVYVATIKPGFSRGIHYHKNRKEWFCVIKGSGRYILTDVNTREQETIQIGEGEFKQIELSPFLQHEIRNDGDDEMILVSAISDLFDKNNTDTYKM